ncbi:FMN-binding protein [Cellulomonas sp. URHD0024]|uniref:FMN-binding protein n=1 Tax=Cellulomonas sp. URHD0024 TaxID=1302620 RepID=UPI000424BDBE|nr:FMN-binding protein [Cellulomonas sp. URHD0024]
MRTPHRHTVALVSGASLVAALASCSQSTDHGTGADVAASTTATESAPSSTNVSDYKNGTYTATGAYTSPAGDESIGVSVTLADGVITAVAVTPAATNPMSQKFQSAFASAVSGVVVGKAVADADVDVVSGASLTPEGFNAALAQIASDAHA